MNKAFRRLVVLWTVTSIAEFAFILFHQFLTRRLSIVRPDLHRLLLFTVGCVERDINIRREQDLLRATWREQGRELNFCVRKYSRDLFVFADFFLQRDYDKFCSMLESRMNQVHFIIDAGANIGCSALYYKCRFPDARIVCIEPETSNFELLQKNVHANGMEADVMLMKRALWTEKTSLDLMQRDWSHDGFLVMPSDKQDEVIARVDTITVPEILEICNAEQIDLLKIDIEGAEKEFFASPEHASGLCSQANAIFMEVHPEFIEESDVVRSLALMRFRCEPIFITGQPVSICATRIE